MMIGSYPCCDGELWLGYPETTPAYLPEDCPHCGAKVWHVFSKIDPMTYMETDFLAAYEVDERTRTIKPRT